MKRGSLYIYDEIGQWGITADEFVAKLDDLKNQGCTAFNVYISSPGGDVFAAITIFNELQALADVRVIINGLAASAASLIAMAGDEIRMTDNSRIMIHNPWTWGAGDAKYFEKLNAQLEDIKGIIVSAYTEKTGRTAQEISDWMNDEEWMEPNTAKDRGFCDKVIKPEEIRNRLSRILNSIIPNEKKETNMLKQLLINLFGLSLAHDASDTDVMNAVTKIMNEQASRIQSLETEKGTLTGKLDDLKGRVQSFEDKAKELRDSEITAILDAAVESGKIEVKARPIYQAQLEANYEATKTILDDLEGGKQLAQTIKPKSGDGSPKSVQQQARDLIAAGKSK